MFLQPLVCVEVVVLFGPEHPRERLADEVGAVAIRLVHCRGQGVIELVRLLEPLIHDRVERPERIAELARFRTRQTEPDHLCGSRTDGQLIVG